MREDGRQQVCIVGLKEFRVSDVELVKEYIDKGNLSRSTGSTGANEESSRSHAILQLVVKKAQEGKEVNRVIGKLSFIDLAGSERGADTTDNDRQTRLALAASLAIEVFLLLQFEFSCEIYVLEHFAGRSSYFSLFTCKVVLCNGFKIFGCCKIVRTTDHKLPDIKKYLVLSHGILRTYLGV